MTTQLNIIAFYGLNLSDQLVSVPGLNITGTNLVSDLITAGTMFIGYGEQGEELVCMCKTLNGVYTLVTPNSSYTGTTAPASVWASLFSTHPIHAPK